MLYMYFIQCWYIYIYICQCWYIYIYISGKQPKQRKECMLFNHPRAHVSALSIKEARTFSKFVYHLKIPIG